MRQVKPGMGLVAGARPPGRARSAKRSVTSGRAKQPASVGEVLERFELQKAWLVEPVSGREGPGEIVVTDGILESVVWLEGEEAKGVDDKGVIVAPGFFDLHAISASRASKTPRPSPPAVPPRLTAAIPPSRWMPNTSPTLDEPGVLERIRSAAPRRRIARRGSGVRCRLGRTGRGAALRDGRAGPTPALSATRTTARRFDRPSSAQRGALRRNARPAGCRHAEDLELTAAAEANEGYVASVLGLAGWPAAAGGERPFRRDLAVLADARRDEPHARLHLTHLSTAASLDLVRGRRLSGCR